MFLRIPKKERPWDPEGFCAQCRIIVRAIGAEAQGPPACPVLKGVPLKGDPPLPGAPGFLL